MTDRAAGTVPSHYRQTSSAPVMASDPEGGRGLKDLCGGGKSVREKGGGGADREVWGHNSGMRSHASWEQGQGPRDTPKEL